MRFTPYKLTDKDDLNLYQTNTQRYQNDQSRH